MKRTLLLLLSVLLAGGLHVHAAPPAMAPFQTPLGVDNLDPAALTQWVDSVESPVPTKEGPRHVIWTQSTAPEWDGIHFGDSRNPGLRSLRIGWNTPLPVGSVLVRAGGSLSVLKPTATYPGSMTDNSQWIPAQRILGSRLTSDEVTGEEYALWVLPPGTVTRALRFTHTAAPTDNTYAGWLGGVYILSARMANLAPQATAAASSRNEAANRINNNTNDGTWGAWDNTPEGNVQLISRDHPEWVMLVWPRPVTLRGLNALWAGFGAAEAQAYTGPADRHPLEAAETDWQPIKTFNKIENQYPRALGVNWMDFEQPVTTRAIRLRITQTTTETHPHLNGKTKEGRRVWLGELMALQPLGDAPLQSALLPTPPAAELGHPPIPIRFTLKEPGFVTLVIEDMSGKRVRNLVSETPFTAGLNTAWWDGADDLGRDTEAARHGVYHIPAQFVQPGHYRVRGLYHKAIDLRYEFSVYNAGHPAWETADGTGGWLTNHTPPQAALFVPADKAPGGKPLVYLGSYVSEGGSGLAWVDLEGHKQGGRGWIGGNWTAAPYLARDAGANPGSDAYAYVGAAWSVEGQPGKGEIRITALTPGGDKPVVKYNFAVTTPGGSVQGTKEHDFGADMRGMAVHNGILVVSLPLQKQLLFVDVHASKALGTAAVEDARGLQFDAEGRLLALVGKQLYRYVMPTLFDPNVTLPAPQVVVGTGLEDPQGLALDAQGNIYIGDRGNSNQVKVFSADGKLISTIGHPGPSGPGPYDRQHMNNPYGLTVDSDNHLWVAENDFQPKRVSVWTLDGKLLHTFYGPSRYGGGGTLDPRDKTLFHYDGMTFKLDWKTGANEPIDVFYRPGPGDLSLGEGSPQTPLYANGQQYMTNCFTSNPTNGAGIAGIWRMKNGIAVPVAALGRANDWPLLKTDAFKPLWPQGIDLNGDYWRNQALCLWFDANGDGQVQPGELTLLKKAAAGVTVMPDLSFLARVDDKWLRYAPTGFTAQGTPQYDLSQGQTLVDGAQGPTSSGGDQALLASNGWTVLTVAPKPFEPQSMGGALHGAALWSYPSLWPGLHASHESPPPDRPGEIIGTTRLLGEFVTPKVGDAGPLWCINGNQGNMYLFTADGLFVTQFFQDVRQGKSWSMPTATRGMRLNDVSLHDENFFPSITQTADGQVYLVDGGRSSLVRVDGLETIGRLPSMPLRVTAGDLKSAQAYLVQREIQRQKAQGTGVLKVALATAAPTVDGKLDDWSGADWASIDKSGVAAYFNSNSKPYDVTGAVAIAGDRLYAAFRTGDPDLLKNSGETPNAPFKNGGALDLMIGAGPGVNDARTGPVEGDVRLLVTRVKDKTLAVLYRAVVPGTKEPVPFSSPWRTVTIDQVVDVSDQVQLAGSEGNYEFSIPLAVLGLKPTPDEIIRGDLGILRGNGFQTLQRVYWSNKATGIVSDVPSEAMLTPQLWGHWLFQSPVGLK